MRFRNSHLRHRQRIVWRLFALLLLLNAGRLVAQTSAFTYQGRLTDGGTPANGNYDLQFALWDSSSGGSQIGATQNFSNISVNSGFFSVTLDFGANAFPGANRFLETSARLSGASAFILLTPRQQITSTPYAVRSANATLADTATNSTQLGGLGSSQYVLTNDSRLTDSRAPTAGSSNYIQNTTNQQASSNFNISGNGTTGGALSASTVNAATQYNIGGNRVLSVTGTNNTFGGLNAGSSNSTGANNSFFGNSAGQANTIGASNTFYGSFAGQNNTASFNSFFGNNAGLVNSSGTGNSFFGYNAGRNTSTGDDNSFYGFNAGNANTTGANNSFFGFRAGLSNTTNGNNSFFGFQAGQNNTANANSFFGSQAGQANTAGGSNSLFGHLAGLNNTSGFANSFFGDNVGKTNTTGIKNSFFGSFAGELNSTGSNNAFFGDSAGLTNNLGGNNSFFGESAGLDNTTGSSNSFIGNGAGGGHQTGDNNIAIGANAIVANGIGNAAAIGANSSVTVSNRMVIGTATNFVYVPGETVLGGNTTTHHLLVLGDVLISGSLLKSSGSFRIDYPLDPAHKFLYHSFVESPDMMNIYNGIATLDEHGAAVVQLPAYFEALNQDFRYQLTAIGAPGPNLYIAAETRNNQFRIAGGKAGGKVSWQVTGIRHDPFAEAYRIKPVVDKPDNERGTYLHPELYNQTPPPASVLPKPQSSITKPKAHGLVSRGGRPCWQERSCS